MVDNLEKVLHDTAKGLHRIGLLDIKTMREFDSLCLPPIKTYSAKQIKAIRLRHRTSQAVFAAYLNTNSSTIQKWEQGAKHPNGPSLKLLNLVDNKGLEALV